MENNKIYQNPRFSILLSTHKYFHFLITSIRLIIFAL